MPLLLTIRSKTPPSERLLEFALEKGKLDVTTLFIDFFGLKRVQMVIYLGIGLGICFARGIGEAVKQKDFLVLQEPPNTVVLRSYGDLMICSNLDRERNAIDGKLMLIRSSGSGKLTLTNEKLGQVQILPHK